MYISETKTNSCEQHNAVLEPCTRAHSCEKEPEQYASSPCSHPTRTPELSEMAESDTRCILKRLSQLLQRVMMFASYPGVFPCGRKSLGVKLLDTGCRGCECNRQQLRRVSICWR